MKELSHIRRRKAVVGAFFQLKSILGKVGKGTAGEELQTGNTGDQAFAIELPGQRLGQLFFIVLIPEPFFQQLHLGKGCRLTEKPRPYGLP